MALGLANVTVRDDAVRYLFVPFVSLSAHLNRNYITGLSQDCQMSTSTPKLIWLPYYSETLLYRSGFIPSVLRAAVIEKSEGVVIDGEEARLDY